MIDWKKKGPNEEAAEYKDLKLRMKKTGTVTAYFIEKDGAVVFNCNEKFDFLRHVELYAGDRVHLRIKQNRI